MASVNKIIKLIEKYMDKQKVDPINRALIYTELSNQLWGLVHKYIKKAVEVSKNEGKRRKKRKNK